MHIVAYCLHVAMATGRVLIISDEPGLNSQVVLKQFFLPITACTEYAQPVKIVNQSFKNDTTQSVQLSDESGKFH